MVNKLIVVTSSFGSARIKKRILDLRMESDTITLYFFNRKNEVPELRDDVIEIVDEYICVGDVEDGKITSRIRCYLKLIKLLFSPFRKDQNYYIFGSDLTFLLLFLKGKINFEVADLRVIDIKPPLKYFLKLLDKVGIRRINKLILTSEYHYKHYYKKLISMEKVIILRNKLPKVNMLTELQVTEVEVKDKITLGLLGVLRYERVIDLLISFVKENQRNYNLVIYGKPSGRYNDDFLSDLDSNNININWEGTYNYPEDLEKIYSGIDINFVVYDNHFNNVKIAIPNKLYESILFKRPILCSTGSEFGFEVNRLGIGKTIRTTSYSDFSQDILSFSKEEIKTCVLNMNEINSTYYFEERQELLK